jgi:hypothetical protein
LITDLVQQKISSPTYSFKDFSYFRYDRIKTEKQVKLNKMSQKSILNDSNKILAKNLILRNAKKCIQELEDNAVPREGKF